MRISLPLLLLTVLFFSGCGQPITNLDSSGKDIICFGDSITSGYGAAPGEDFPAILNGHYKDLVINAGKAGETTRGALTRMESEVLSRNPKMVIIEFGANDYFQKIPSVETLRNLENIVKAVQKAGAVAVLVEVRPALLSERFGQSMKELALKTQAGFVPHVLKGIISDPHLKSDTVHPNAKGYAIIAKRIHKIVGPILRRMK